MSNYPPGVTGNEYEIAGADAEWIEERQCNNDEFDYVMVSPEAFKYASELGSRCWNLNDRDEIIKEIGKHLRQLNTLFNLTGGSGEVQHGKCGFVGDVMLESYRDKIYWSCPTCGKDHEETIENYYSE
jgi:hypothetical protein